MKFKVGQIVKTVKNPDESYIGADIWVKACIGKVGKIVKVENPQYTHYPYHVIIGNKNVVFSERELITTPTRKISVVL